MTNNRCQRHRNIDAIARSSIHQSLATPSSQMAMARSKSSTLNDPKQALDLIRSLIQSEINEKIQIIMQEYVDSLFQPAVQNIRKNLDGNVNASLSALLVEEVCCSALDHAKLAFKTQQNAAATSASSEVKSSTASLATRLAVKRKLTQSIANCNAKKRLLQPGSKSDLPLLTGEGKPVRREGPKWDGKRINLETLFILGAKACRLLGYKRGSRLYSTHPTLFKYTLDQEDKDRLVEANLIPLNYSAGKKVNVLIAEDVIEIADNMQIGIGPQETLRQSFKCPPAMIDKMKIFIDLVKTDPSESDEMLLKKCQPAILAQDHSVAAAVASTSSSTVHDINESVSEEDLGFLQSMNLTSLVREFEMEANGQGSQHLGILSLADDVSENPFSELEDHHQQQPNGNMPVDTLNDIEYDVALH